MSHDPLINVQAEAILLGAMMMKNSLIGEAADRLKEGDFAEPIHQRIFSAMMRFAAKGALASAVSLRPVFAMDPDADGGGYLDMLVDSPLALVTFPSHLEQVVDLSARRQARDALQRGIEDLTDLDLAVQDVFGSVEESVWATQAGGEVDEFCGQDDLLDLVLDRQEKIDSGEISAGIPNAIIPDLDDAMGGLNPDYILMAGRPGSGKTTLAACAARGYSLNGACGLYFDTEMSKVQQAMRTTADLTNWFGHAVPHDDIRKGKLDQGQRHWIKQIRERSAMIPLRYLHVGACSANQIFARVAREKARLAALGKSLAYVVVDWLGKLTATDASGREITDPRLRMMAVSKVMMRIRDQLKVAVIALAQLSRDVDKRVDKRPHMGDLKESGCLEEDADTIILIYREEYYLEREKPKKGTMERGEDLYETWFQQFQSCRGQMDMIFGKNRHGAVCTKEVTFNGEQYSVRGGRRRMEEAAATDLYNPEFT